MISFAQNRSQLAQSLRWNPRKQCYCRFEAY